MVRKRKHVWTTISLPLHVKRELEEYGKKSESWGDLFIRMMREMDDAKRLKEKYRLK